MKKFSYLFFTILVSQSLFAGGIKEEVLSETRVNGKASKVVRYNYWGEEFTCSVTSNEKKNDQLLSQMNMSTICVTAYQEQKYTSIDLRVTNRGNYNVGFDCEVEFPNKEVKTGRCGLGWWPGDSDFSYRF